MNCLTLPCRRGTRRGCVWVECSHPWKHAKTLLHFFAGHANRLRRFPGACEGRTFYGYRRSRAVLRLQTHMLQDDCDRLSIRPSTHAQSVGKASWQYAVSRRWDRSCWCLVLHPSQKRKSDLHHYCPPLFKLSIPPRVFQSTNPYLSHCSQHPFPSSQR